MAVFIAATFFGIHHEADIRYFILPDAELTNTKNVFTTKSATFFCVNVIIYFVY
jgi:hypothetical protein